MFRKDFVQLLRDSPRRVSELAKLFDIPPREVDDHLRHLSKSLKYSDFQLRVDPARCRKCGFIFAPDRYTKPGKCPLCHATWISEPLIQTQEKHRKRR